jgi:hypothetical protein
MQYKTYAKSIQIFDFLCPTWRVGISTFNVPMYEIFSNKPEVCIKLVVEIETKFNSF